jgi:hypothetical protein
VCEPTNSDVPNRIFGTPNFGRIFGVVLNAEYAGALLRALAADHVGGIVPVLPQWWQCLAKAARAAFRDMDRNLRRRSSTVREVYELHLVDDYAGVSNPSAAS